MLLALDTATQTLGIALHDGEDIIAEQMIRTENQHSVLLADAIRQTMARCGVSMAHLHGVAVSIGPGSYTGLRIGVALAKGIALAQQLPLVGISTMEMLAAAHPPTSGKIDLVTTIAAGRGRVIAQTYKWAKGQWSAKGEAAIYEWPALIASWSGPVALSGDISPEARALLTQAGQEGASIVIAPAPTRLLRAGWLAEEAQRRLREKPNGDYRPAHLVPIYIKTTGVP